MKSGCICSPISTYLRLGNSLILIRCDPHLISMSELPKLNSSFSWKSALVAFDLICGAILSQGVVYFMARKQNKTTLGSKHIMHGITLMQCSRYVNGS